MKRGRTMEQNKKVHLNYFQMIFRREFNILGESFIVKKFGFIVLNELIRNSDVYATFPFYKKRIELYNTALVLMGKEYCKLTKTEIEHPELWNTFSYIEQILKTISDVIYPKEIPNNKKVSYQESFLWALEMICKDYFFFLENGDITLSSSEDKQIEEKYLKVVLNADNKMVECEAINMDMLESSETLLHILKLEKDGKIGPVPNVNYIYRKDI